jgi:CTP synthase (UTP-ammonia lyase)
MSSPGPDVLIAVVGDHSPAYLTHALTDEAFSDLGVRIEWVPTPTVLQDPSVLGSYGGCLMAPGTPYTSMEGALEAVRYARTHDLPLLGTCGGFQHMLVEYARNVAGITDADHAEMNPQAANLVCVPLSCSLVGQQHAVRIEAGSFAAAVYGTSESVEPFYCSFGLNDAFRPALEAAGLRFSGFGASGEPRVLELPGHRFFLGTLYVPQAASRRGRPHPVLNAFIQACARTAAP